MSPFSGGRRKSQLTAERERTHSGLILATLVVSQDREPVLATLRQFRIRQLLPFMIEMEPTSYILIHLNLATLATLKIRQYRIQNTFNSKVLNCLSSIQYDYQL